MRWPRTKPANSGSGPSAQDLAAATAAIETVESLPLPSMWAGQGLVDLAQGRGHWPAFAQSALVTGLAGTLVALSCRNAVREGLTLHPSDNRVELDRSRHALDMAA